MRVNFEHTFNTLSTHFQLVLELRQRHFAVIAVAVAVIVIRHLAARRSLASLLAARLFP